MHVVECWLRENRWLSSLLSIVLRRPEFLLAKHIFLSIVWFNVDRCHRVRFDQCVKQRPNIQLTFDYSAIQFHSVSPSSPLSLSESLVLFIDRFVLFVGLCLDLRKENENKRSVVFYSHKTNLFSLSLPLLVKHRPFTSETFPCCRTKFNCEWHRAPLDRFFGLMHTLL